MKTIQITNSTKKAINDKYSGSFDNNINNLIKEVADYMPLVELDDNHLSSANLKEETYELLKSFKLSDGESFENILIRMLLISQILNSDTDQYY